MHIRILIFLFLFASIVHGQVEDGKVRTLIVVLDGLRPDYITPELMPNLYALKKNGSYGTAHHSVFPTVTRVNASSYATGSYPSSHGLLGNTVYFPAVDASRGLDTGEASELMRIADKTNKALLTSVSLGELLQQAGERFMVFSSGSSGQAYLQNHTVSGGAVVNPELILPDSFKSDVLKTIGTPPPSAKPNTAQHDWATRAWLTYGLDERGPLVSAIWLSDPDGSAHAKGIGHPMAIQSLKSVDGQLGVILKALEDRQLLHRFNIIVTADHGFVTNAGTTTLTKFLLQKGLKHSQTSDDVVIAGNAVYVKDHSRETIQRIVSALQEQPWVGAVFTKGETVDTLNGWAGGTLSFESIHWNHERSADLLVDYNWDDRENAFGYKGTSFASGVAGHGGASPYEIHIPLIVTGPAFKKEYSSAVPTSNIDIVPTILHIYALPIPSSMDGRVMDEMLGQVNGQEPEVKKEVTESSVKSGWGKYTVRLHTSSVGNHRYIDFVQVERTPQDRK